MNFCYHCGALVACPFAAALCSSDQANKLPTNSVNASQSQSRQRQRHRDRRQRKEPAHAGALARARFCALSSARDVCENVKACAPDDTVLLQRAISAMSYTGPELLLMAIRGQLESHFKSIAEQVRCASCLLVGGGRRHCCGSVSLCHTLLSLWAVSLAGRVSYIGSLM